MSQHDLDIANQGFAAFRADLNNALQALGSLSSGVTAPATPYANQLWYQTDTNTLHIRDETNSSWLDLMTINQTTGAPSFVSGNVGIGTSSPSGILTLQQTTSGLTAGLSTNHSTTTTTYGALSAIGTDTVALTAGSTASDSTALTFYTASSGTEAESMRVDSEGRVIIGHTASIAIAGGSAQRLQVSSTGGAGASFLRCTPDANGADIRILKSRATTPGSYSTVVSGDPIGNIVFAADDGSSYNEIAASIRSSVDGTVSTGIVPGRLTFSTNSTSGILAERMRIHASGGVSIGNTTDPGATNLSVTGSVKVGSATMAAPSGSAPLFAARAWVCFTGTGSVTIRASGNVTSITDNGTGDYTVNFTTAMPSANLGVNVTSSSGQARVAALATTSCGVQTRDTSGALTDSSTVVLTVII